MTTTADYTEKIPNNVSLHEDRRLQRALESWQPNFLHWWQTMGPTLPTQDVYLRTAVNVGRDGWAQFGHVPCPSTAGASSWPNGTRAARSGSASTRASRCGTRSRGVPGRAAAADRDPGRHRARLGGAAAQPGRHRAEPVRPAQPVPGERRGGPAPVGDGLPAARLLRPGGPGGGRGTAAPQLGQPRLAAHPGRVQRGDPGLAVVLHVHLLHRPGRQVPARHAEGKRLRPAQPHLRVHAQGGGAPHDGGHHRRGPGGAAHRRGDARARHRATWPAWARSRWRSSRST